MDSEALGAADLAGLAEVTEAEIGRMVDLGVLVPREGPAPFRATDTQKVRLATACERAGLPMDTIAEVIRAGRLSFAFMEAAPYQRWALPSTRSFRQVSQDTGIPLETLREVLEAMGFAWTSADDPVREDELEVVPLIRLAFSSGLLDQAWLSRVGRVYAEGMRLAAHVENEAYAARFEEPVLASGLGQRQAMERASEIAGEFLPLVDRALMAVYRRQQELIWTEHQVLNIEAALEEAGAIVRPERVPAMCFLDLAGYTRLTEERGDRAAAALATSLADLVEQVSLPHGGQPVKWLGDGVMFHFKRPGQAVVAALEMVERTAQAGLPPAHVGLHAGPVVFQDGDYFGRTVNLAARIAAHAGPGQVLVSDQVVAECADGPVAFEPIGPVPLKGVADPVPLHQAIWPTWSHPARPPG